MKATRKHKDNSSRQARQSSYHYRISKAVKAVAIIIGAVIGILDTLLYEFLIITLWKMMVTQMTLEIDAVVVQLP